MTDITGKGRAWNQRERKVGTVLSGWTAVRVDDDTNLVLWKSKSGKIFNVETIRPMKIVKKYTTQKEADDYMDTAKKTLAESKEKEAASAAPKPKGK